MANVKEKLRSVAKPTKKKVIILAVVAMLAAGFGFVSMSANKRRAAMSNNMIQTDMVTRGDVEVTITGSGSVEPNERYEIISMVSGDIVSSAYDVGDVVEKDTILYQFDTSDTDLAISRQEIAHKQSGLSYEQALEQLDKLQITATSDGVISGLSCKVGDDINTGTRIATIENTKTLEVTLPFNQAQIHSIYVGQRATISSSAHMSTVLGWVTDVAANPKAQADGSSLYDVTIQFENPGAFTVGLAVGGEIDGMISPGSGVIEYSQEGNVVAEASGTIESIRYKNGDFVKKGAVIATLSSSATSNQVENSRLSYENSKIAMQQSRESLEDYSIKSPINGTIITKNAKAGDTIDKTNSNQVLMVVADISKLKFDLEIDELDVSKVKVGQRVSITSDALEGETFIGEITNVSVEGIATNGVTTYTAEVVINEPGNLRPSMSVDASVIVESSENTLIVPTSDIKTIMGKHYVYVQEPDGKKSDKKDTAKSESKDPSNDAQLPEAPNGFRTVEVQIGVSGDDFTEILSGVKEGDIIQALSVNATGNIFDAMMSGMGGAPMGDSTAGGPQSGGFRGNAGGMSGARR